MYSPILISKINFLGKVRVMSSSVLRSFSFCTCKRFCFRSFSKNFPKIYTWKNQENRPADNKRLQNSTNIEEAKLSLKQIYHLEQLSLVDFSNQAAIDRLSSAIRFANRLKDVNTTGVKPLFSLLENQTLRLRPDEVTEGNAKDEIFRNAKLIVEDFFVAPPGNIPLEQTHSYGESDISDTSIKSSVSHKAQVTTSIDLKKAWKKS